MKSQVVSKLTQLISDETMKQLAENYHELLPKLIKIDVDHIEEDLSYAVGAVYFMLNGRVIFIPVIYRDGAVDSISYIGDTENETLYGLTKKMYKRIISASKTDFGKPIDEKEQERLIVDKGIIGRLFATPQTISPKVAADENYHDNMIIEMLENPIFANSFQKLASMPEYDEVLHKIYSDRVFEKLETVQSMHKLASAVYNDRSEMVYTKIADLSGLPQKKRKEAAKAIAKDGFYKVAADTTPTKGAVLSLPSIGEMLMKVKSRLQVLTEPGIYNALTKNLQLAPVVVARDGFGTLTKILYKDQSVTVRQGEHQQGPKNGRYYNDKYDNPGFIGLEAGAVNDDPRAHIVSVVGETLDPKKARRVMLIADKDDLTVMDIVSVTKVGNELVVEVWSSYDGDKMSIVVGEHYGYTKSGSTVYVHPNHIIFFRGKDSKLSSSLDDNKPAALSTLLTTDDLDAAFVKTASEHTLTYSAGAYNYDGQRMAREGVVFEMRRQGFDDDSIDTIIKTAQAGPNMPVDFAEVTQTLKAILAEITESKIALRDLQAAIGAQGGQPAEASPEAQAPAQEDGMPQVSDDQVPEEDKQALTQEIMDVAASVGADGNAVIQAGKAQGMSLPQIAAQIHKEVAALQAKQSGGQPAEGQEQPVDGGQGAPIDQDIAAQQAQAQGQPQGQGQVAGQAPGERTVQDLQTQGYNTNMTPEMLDQLQQIADKDVLNASIISYLVDTQDAKAVTQKYIEDITRGVNGLARTLLLVEVQRGAIVDQVGDKQLSSFVSRGKTLLNRLTDFVIDVSIIE